MELTELQKARLNDLRATVKCLGSLGSRACQSEEKERLTMRLSMSEVWAILDLIQFVEFLQHSVDPK